MLTKIMDLLQVATNLSETHNFYFIFVFLQINIYNTYELFSVNFPKIY